MALGSRLIAFLGRDGGGVSDGEAQEARGSSRSGVSRGRAHSAQGPLEQEFGCGRAGPRRGPGRPSLYQALRMTGLPLTGRGPSAHNSTMSLRFFFICFFPLGLLGEAVASSEPPPWKWGWGGSQGLGARGPRAAAAGSAPPTPPPGTGRRDPGLAAPPPPPRGAREAVRPAHVAGGPERGAGRPPHNGGVGQPRAPPLPRAPRAPEGSRTGLPGGGRGGERGPANSSGRGGYLTPLLGNSTR